MGNNLKIELDIIKQAAAALQCNLADHHRIQEAIRKIEKELNDKTKKEETTDE